MMDEQLSLVNQLGELDEILSEIGGNVFIQQIYETTADKRSHFIHMYNIQKKTF